MKGSVPF